MKTPFFGGHTVSRSTNLADNQLVNLYPELVETRDGKAVGALFPCPGLTLYAALPQGPVRGMFCTPNVAYVVGGNQLYTVSNFGAPGSAPLVQPYAGMTLPSTIGPVSIVASGMNIGAGSQVAMFDGQVGKIIGTTGTASTITLPFTGLQTPAAYQDGFALIGQGSSQTIWQSNLFDLSAWSALAFQAATGSFDQIVALATLQRQVWVFKQFNTEVWVDNGTSPFAFGALQGVFIQQGCAAPFSIGRSSESLMWLSQNTQGRGMVLEASGYQAQRISTHALEHTIAGYSTIFDATAYTYQQDGHDFYVLTFPSANATWCYDRATRLWHQRASFAAGVFGRHLGNCQGFFQGLNLIGDYSSGNVYFFDQASTLDNGRPRKWLRSWRAMAQPSTEPQRFTALTLDMQTGIGLPDGGAAPQIMMRWSDDGGHNWSSVLQASAGKMGQTARRVSWKRLGSTRRATGLDRIFEISSVDQFGAALMGADLT